MESHEVANQTLEAWQHVAWSDESWYQLFWAEDLAPMKPWTLIVNKAVCRLGMVPYWCGVCSHGLGWVHWST